MNRPIHRLAACRWVWRLQTQKGAHKLMQSEAGNIDLDEGVEADMVWHGVTVNLAVGSLWVFYGFLLDANSIANVFIETSGWLSPCFSETGCKRWQKQAREKIRCGKKDSKSMCLGCRQASATSAHDLPCASKLKWIECRNCGYAGFATSNAGKLG